MRGELVHGALHAPRRERFMPRALFGDERGDVQHAVLAEGRSIRPVERCPGENAPRGSAKARPQLGVAVEGAVRF